MSWSLLIGRVAGIGIYLHWTFLILLGFIAYASFVASQSLLHALLVVGYVLALFGCILLHELGHAMAARAYGIGTHDITLLPIGGVARLKRMPEEPMKEFWIAVAGPAVNVVIAGTLFLFLWARGERFQEINLDITRGDMLVNLMTVNIILVVFNMIPAFPMDGGRVLRALLAMVMPRILATNIAARLGQALAIGFGIVGLFFNPFLIFIAIFVFLGAGAEAAAVGVRETFRNILVKEAMATRFRTLTPHDTLQTAVDELLAGHQQDFPVVDGDRVVGLLTRNALVEALSQRGPGSRVADSMSSQCGTVDVHTPLIDAIEYMRDSECATLPVTYDGQLIGILTNENIGEWMVIRSALGAQRR